jgi:enhancing lycopene biosynthesis protein 2
MKYILILWVCSFIEGNSCLTPMESPKLYNSWYECSIDAHKESAKLLQKMGYANVNKYQIGTKYTCKPTKSL